jgi:hypothetical protein
MPDTHIRANHEQTFICVTCGTQHDPGWACPHQIAAGRFSSRRPPVHRCATRRALWHLFCDSVSVMHGITRSDCWRRAASRAYEDCGSRLPTRQIAAQLTSSRAADERAKTSPLKLLHNALPKQPKMHRNRCMPPHIPQQHSQG